MKLSLRVAGVHGQSHLVVACRSADKRTLFPLKFSFNRVWAIGVGAVGSTLAAVLAEHAMPADRAPPGIKTEAAINAQFEEAFAFRPS
jgi:hypothetical protein